MWKNALQGRALTVVKVVRAAAVTSAATFISDYYYTNLSLLRQITCFCPVT